MLCNTCNTCIHYKVCGLKSEYNDLKDKAKVSLDEPKEFLISILCSEFTVNRETDMDSCLSDSNIED